MRDPLTPEAWAARMATRSQNWWKNVPPGILLLFLLATLGGLYRYNLRIARFHHSRADALELFSENPDDNRVAVFSQLADALAADKVEFGKGSLPADQAADLAKALLAKKV